jgi:hypothetical protein
MLLLGKTLFWSPIVHPFYWIAWTELQGDGAGKVVAAIGIPHLSTVEFNLKQPLFGWSCSVLR